MTNEEIERGKSMIGTTTDLNPYYMNEREISHQSDSQGGKSSKKPQRSHTEDPFAGNLSERRRGTYSEVLPKAKKDKKKKRSKREASDSRS